MKTFAISGKVTLNGIQPANLGTWCSTNASQAKAYVDFTDAARGYQVTVAIPCSSTDYQFSGQLFPGTYQVRVRGRYTEVSNLPLTSYQAVAQLSFP